MPYIEKGSRKNIEGEASPVVANLYDYTVGDLNYLFTRIMQEWLKSLQFS